ncbi:hypothetical protein ACFQT0_14060 [Hymenobacter humi]|uniref:Uncharacterized protein n=1 Tax=Hymenobacter humi TaxID=1411620 RepID=A0ABW2U7K6_9BACT
MATSLYFYISARDNAGHSSRTDSYLVQWQDTAVADSQADMGMGVKVAPAYFRSQRQIIIDTEKLIAEKPRLAPATVADRANALGFDQQTLRLRYGKFMGEEVGGSMAPSAPPSPIAEDEDEAPTADHAGEKPGEADEHHEHDTPPATSAKASPTAESDALMEPYMHKHDDSETADFLEPAVKAKLRAVLNEMWAAELRLRTGQAQGRAALRVPRLAPAQASAAANPCLRQEGGLCAAAHARGHPAPDRRPGRGCRAPTPAERTGRHHPARGARRPALAGAECHHNPPRSHRCTGAGASRLGAGRRGAATAGRVFAGPACPARVGSRRPRRAPRLPRVPRPDRARPHRPAGGARSSPGSSTRSQPFGPALFPRVKPLAFWPLRLRTSPFIIFY